MSTTKKVKSALISVFHKDGLEPVVRQLNDLGVTLYSTGGTEKFIKDLGIEVIAVEDLTSYPSILGGRVKTLHPKVFGGILGRRENRGDLEQLESYEIPEIDVVIVDLYPFEKTVASGASEQDIIEKIDIGGISLIRAAAKNHKDVAIVVDPHDYGQVIQEIRENDGNVSDDYRQPIEDLGDGARHLPRREELALLDVDGKPGGGRGVEKIGLRRVVEVFHTEQSFGVGHALVGEDELQVGLFGRVDAGRLDWSRTMCLVGWLLSGKRCSGCRLTRAASRQAARMGASGGGVPAPTPIEFKVLSGYSPTAPFVGV